MLQVPFKISSRHLEIIVGHDEPEYDALYGPSYFQSILHKFHIRDVYPSSQCCELIQNEPGNLKPP